jgi:hypothetical protein
MSVAAGKFYICLVYLDVSAVWDLCILMWCLAVPVGPSLLIQAAVLVNTFSA